MARHRVVVLLREQVLPLDFAIPMHVLGREAAEFYDVVTATADGAAVAPAGSGLHLQPAGDLRLLRTADTVLVPGYGGAAASRVDQPTLTALASAARRGARMVSICSGAFALAQAGVLDGHEAATHWSLCDDLARQHPGVTVLPGAMFTDGGSVLTSGGVTAGVDLLLHLLRRDLGSSVANHVARRIVMAPRTGESQAQFAVACAAPAADDDIAEVQQWMLAHLDEPLSVARMATRAAMSPRTFHRRFQERAALTPLAWLHQQRIERTKALLETTDLPVERIASRVGLGSPANLRVHFRRATSVSPSRYRQLFGLGASAAAGGSATAAS